MKYNFDPKTPKEEEICRQEFARVDREVSEYENSWRCKLHSVQTRAREWSWDNRLIQWISRRPQALRFFYQRLTRGFDDSATWSLDTHLAQLIAPRLKLFKKLNTHAWPGPVEGMPETGLFSTFEEWQEALGKMIYAFECYASEDRDYWEFSEVERKKIQEGLFLFAKCYGALWD